MSVTSTPIRSAGISQKRVLSSPEDLVESKKNKVLAETGSDTLKIFDLSTMDEGLSQSVDQNPRSSENVISLKAADLSTIATFIKQSFEPQIKEMISSIVEGVVSGSNSTIASLRQENAELKARIEMLENKAEAADQYSRRNSLRIAGVPENQSENTDVYVIDLSRAIEAEVSLDDIELSHRVGKPRNAGRPRDIIVKFSSYRTRRKLYEARTKTRDRGYRGVYINEDLTKSRSKLLLKARRMVKNKLLNSAWSSDGNILVRDLRDIKHIIRAVGDLAKFGPVPLLNGEAPATDSFFFLFFTDFPGCPNLGIKC